MSDVTTTTPPLADAARRAWRVRTAEAVAAAAAEQVRALRGPDDLVSQLETLARREPADATDPPGGVGALLLAGCEPLVRTCLALLLEARGVAVVAAADGFKRDRLAADRAGVRAELLDVRALGVPVAAAVGEFRRLDPLLPVALLGRPGPHDRFDDVRAVLPPPFGVSDVLWAVREASDRTAG